MDRLQILSEFSVPLLWSLIGDVLLVGNCILWVGVLARYYPKRKFGSWMGCIVLMLAANFTYEFLLNRFPQTSSVWLWALEIVPTYLYVFILYRSLHLRLWMMTFAYRLIESTAKCVFLFGYGLFRPEIPETDIAVSQTDAGVRVLLCVILLACLLIAQCRNTDAIQIGKKEIGMIVLTVSVYLALFLFTAYLITQCANEDRTLLAFGSFFSLFLFLAIPLFAFRMVRSAMRNRQLELKMAQYKSTERRNEAVFRAYHDYRNNLQSIANHLRNADPEGAARYIRELNEDLVQSEKEFMTGNTFLDSILSSEQARAEKVNAEIGFFGIFPMEGIRETDICTCFDNALQNAIEACEGRTEKSLIRIRSVIVQNRVYIQIQNPVHSAVTKTNREPTLHGFGLRNIRRTVQKYDGSVSARTDTRDTFTLEFSLQFKNE